MAVDPGFDATLMLAADADRERAVDVLKASFAEGRLSRAEYDDRTARGYAARTYGELAALTADLPSGPLGGAAHYPGAWYPPRQAARAGTNSMAVAALVCGIAEFFTMGLTAVPAIVLGHAARRQLRRTGQSGDAMALAGLILGWAGIALIAAAVAALIVIARHSGQAVPAHPAVVDPVIVHPAVVLPDMIYPTISLKHG
jgi:uncharacterized membrane protein